jgi:hypothetical protein
VRLETHQEATALAEEIDLPGEQWSMYAELSELHQLRGDEDQARQFIAHVAEIKESLANKIDDEQLRTAFLSAQRIRSILA